MIKLKQDAAYERIASQWCEKYKTGKRNQEVKKPIYEILGNDIETVEDLIEALLIAPKGYKLHPMGIKYALAVDHIHEYVYSDEEMLMNDYGYEIVSEAKEMALPVEIDVPDEKLATYADKQLYVVIGYEDVCDNGNYEAILYGVYSTEQLAREAAEELLELGNIHHYEIECPKLDEFGWR